MASKEESRRLGAALLPSVQAVRASGYRAPLPLPLPCCSPPPPLLLPFPLPCCSPPILRQYVGAAAPARIRRRYDTDAQLPGVPTPVPPDNSCEKYKDDGLGSAVHIASTSLHNMTAAMEAVRTTPSRPTRPSSLPQARTRRTHTRAHTRAHARAQAHAAAGGRYGRYRMRSRRGRRRRSSLSSSSSGRGLRRAIATRRPMPFP